MYQLQVTSAELDLTSGMQSVGLCDLEANVERCSDVRLHTHRWKVRMA
jgi:hypothetical protein